LEGHRHSGEHLIHQHVEHLSSDDQAILETASVVGPSTRWQKSVGGLSAASPTHSAEPTDESFAVRSTSFSVAAVATGVEQGEAEIEARCTTWIRQDQFLYAEGVETWPDGTVTAGYRFRHALYHEVVYARVSAGQRVRLHRQIGNGLEARYGAQAATIAAELAVHFERGGADQRAVIYLHQAAENARQRSAYLEALAHLTRGLEIATRLPDTLERARYEFALQRDRGAALVALKGYAAPEVAQAYGRARILCDQLGSSSERFPAIYGLYAFHTVRAELQTASELGMQLFQLGQDQIAPAFTPAAHFGLGAIFFHTGEPVRALEYLEQASALYDPQQHDTQVAQHGVDCGVFAHAYASHTLWLLGYPDQALSRCQSALSLACQLSHPFSIVLSLCYLAMLAQLRGAPKAAGEHAAAAITLSSDQGFNYYFAWSCFLQSWARMTGNRNASDIVPMHQSLSDLEATGARLRRPYYLSIMAQSDGRAGQVDSASSLLAQALAETQAETRFRQGLEIAQQQDAKSLELRAATSLSRLWQSQNKRQDAYALLAPVYDWFTEGFDTAGLQEAKQLLDKLSVEMSPPTAE
jgi:adenylate cyclase